MTRRAHAARWLTAVVFVAVLALALAAACGSSDKWVGTWKDKDDSALVIEKSGSGYKLSDPDGSDAFTATVGSDGALHGKFDMSQDPKNPMMADVVLTLKGDTIDFEVSAGGKTINYELTKD